MVFTLTYSKMGVIYMSIMLCTKCRGLKTVAPLGGINTKCDLCSGVGHVECGELITDKIKPAIEEHILADKRKDQIPPIKIDKRSKAYRDSLCQ